MARPLALLAALPAAARAAATVEWGHEPMRMSNTGPQSTLPSFFFMAGDEEGGDIFHGFGYAGGSGTSGKFSSSHVSRSSSFRTKLE